MSSKGEKLVKDSIMDEGILNDLLECSVCFERLDTSSKVLPCQHTFCKKCLGGIVEKHKELRCPECRVLVPCKIEDLPPNVLLMRILEGMKNSVPKKQPQRLIRVVNHNTPQIHQTVDHRHTPVKQSNQHLIHGHQPYAKALYDYTSNEPGDLNFKRGDIIILKKRIDNNWYQGECGGNQGVFPLIYVQMITPLPSNVPQCKALYDFRMTNDDEEGCLTFNKSDIITVIRRVDENWAEGKLDDKIGIFPLAFVELNNLARSLMKLSTNSQPGPSKLAPPTPTSDDSTPLIPTDHTRVISNVHVQNRAVQSPLANQTTPVPQPQPIPNSDSSSTVSSANSSSTTPNTSSGGTSSSSSTAPSSPASPPTRTQTNVPPRTTPKPDLVPNTSAIVTTPQRTPTNPPVVSTPSSEPHSSHHHHHHHHREKRHSFTSLSTPQHHSSSHRHSAEILSTENETQTPPQAKASPPSDPNNIQLPQAYVALYPYKPQKSDELELRKGGIYIVTERCQDGWFKGTSNRTQKCGVFPGNYVTLARGAPRSPQTSTRSGDSSSDNKSVVSYIRNSKTQHSANSLPPDLPPRSSNPATATNTISSSWHGQQDSAAVPLGRSSSAIMSSIANSSHLPTNCAPVGKTVEKQKERREKGTVSLMRRLTSIKRPKSPRASSYSMDNPVFEDSSVAINSPHPVHVRSGSCPSQLLQVQPAENHRIFVSTSQRLKHKDRPSVLAHNSRTTENMAGSSKSNQNVHHHRKSNSLDAGNRSKTGTQTVRERFRCIAPYPPNSEYELELQVNDVIYVHKKREDGWYKGTQQRTGRTGLFPASFVESF